MEELVSSPGTSTDNLYPALFECFIIIFCGYMAGRLNIISQSESKGLATFVGNFALPSLIFLSLAELDFTAVNWWFLLAILLAKSAVFFSVIIITLLIAKPLNLGRAGLFAIFCTQSNDFAIGYPIVVAVYKYTHPEYASYIYLMAPISLVILNPVAFVLMEIHKQREDIIDQIEMLPREKNPTLNMIKRVLKGITFNPILVMTILGIIGNLIFKSSVPIYLSGILNVLGSAFSGSALFLLGLRMVGQFHRLKGPALLLPAVLIIAKLLVLPVLMRESVSLLKAGNNSTETETLSTYGFLYGTIPTAPAVFVFSNQYQLEMDLIASSMVVCTFISAPLMSISARMITITQDYITQMQKYAFGLSIVSTIASVWLIIVFVITKKYTRMPHRITLCLIVSQIIMTAAAIWGGVLTQDSSELVLTIKESLRLFGMISSRLWTSMLAMTIFLLESRGPCFVIKVWPSMCLIAWCGAAVLVSILMMTKASSTTVNMDDAINAIGLCVLIFSLTVTSLSLILYARYRKRNAHYQNLAAEIAASGPYSINGEDRDVITNETTSLVENIVQVGVVQSPGGKKYGAVKDSPTRNCCGDDPNCHNLQSSQSTSPRAADIEDLLTNNGASTCACPPSATNRCQQMTPLGDQNEPCPYIAGLEAGAHSLGLSPTEQSRGRGGQMLKHTIVVIAYCVSMFVGVAYTAWSLVLNETIGIYVELEFLDISLNYGQSLVLWALFALDPEEILLPVAKYFRRICYGADTINLPPLDELSFETKHACDQFITHHLDKCKQAITKDTRWRMHLYRNVFRGSCLVRWLVEHGIAQDSGEAVSYAKHLLDGRVISHVNRQHHFHNSPLLYTFI